MLYLSNPAMPVSSQEVYSAPLMCILELQVSGTENNNITNVLLPIS